MALGTAFRQGENGMCSQATTSARIDRDESLFGPAPARPEAAERLVTAYGERAAASPPGSRGTARMREETVQDALCSVIRKIDTFRGDSAFGSGFIDRGQRGVPATQSRRAEAAHLARRRSSRLRSQRQARRARDRLVGERRRSRASNRAPDGARRRDRGATGRHRRCPAGATSRASRTRRSLKWSPQPSSTSDARAPARLFCKADRHASLDVECRRRARGRVSRRSYSAACTASSSACSVKGLRRNATAPPAALLHRGVVAMGTDEIIGIREPRWRADAATPDPSFPASARRR